MNSIFTKTTKKIAYYITLFALVLPLLLGAMACSKPKNPNNDGGGSSSKYTGYDGYIWDGTERTEKIDVKFEALAENVLESTLGIESEPMSNYFEGEYLDISSSHVALMSYYIESNGYSIPDDWQNPKQYTAYQIPVTGKTGYSSTILESITVYAEEEGTLYISTARITDIYNARTKGTALKTTAPVGFSVTEGENVLYPDLFVAGDSTVILGGNNSVGIYSASGIDANDQQGNYLLLDGTADKEMVSSTDGVKNKLCIKTTLSFCDEPIHDTRETYIEALSYYSVVASNLAPFTYYDTTLLANKKITQIEIPVRSVSAINNNQVFTLRVANKNSAINSGNFGGYTYKVKLPVAELNGCNASAVNKWITVDLREYDITVGASDVLLFGDSTDNVMWTWAATNLSKKQLFYANTNGANNAMVANVNKDTNNNYLPNDQFNNNLMFKVYTESTADIADQMGELKENYVYVDMLQGKNVSIIGDSISTFNGVNNNNQYNSTIGANAVFYLGKGSHCRVVDKPADTWWGRTLDKLSMKLCVNGAWSGSATCDESEKPADDVCRDAYLAAGCNTRPYNLHKNVGERVDPDYLFVYMGTNDCIRNNANSISTGVISDVNWDKIANTNWEVYQTKTGYASADWLKKDVEYKYYTNVLTQGANADGRLNFIQSYALMMYKIHKTYPNAKIFCYTVLPFGNKTDWDYNDRMQTIMAHNTAIKSVCEHFGDVVVDLYTALGGSSYVAYPNSVGDSLHPNEEGMRLMSDCLINAIYEQIDLELYGE